MIGELKKYQIAFSKTTEKSDFKMPRVRKEENRVEINWSWKKLKQRRSRILNNGLKPNDSSHLLPKAFHIRYFS